MKEFIEQLKLYKEFIGTIATIVIASLLIVNFFATKAALTETQKTLKSLINERECLLDNRIVISEMSSAIANLERERLEKMKQKLKLLAESKARLSPVDEMYNKEALDQISKDFQRIDEDVKTYREKSRISSENLSNGTCMKLGEEEE